MPSSNGEQTSAEDYTGKTHLIFRGGVEPHGRWDLQNHQEPILQKLHRQFSFSRNIWSDRSLRDL